MIRQGVVKQRIFFYCLGLHVISSFLVGSSSIAGQDLDSNIKAAQSRESDIVSPHLTKEVVKPSLTRNRRSNLFPENGHLYGNNADLNSAFLYNDQIMQNLLSSPPSKPLSYAHSNFFLNYLKPRTTRYNAWDDHSLMHFGKRSLENDIDAEKSLIKRSTDFWSPNNVLHFGKKSENLLSVDESPQNSLDMKTDDINSDSKFKSNDYQIPNPDAESEYHQIDNVKKSADPWHSMMSFGKKSNSWDHNTLHFGKKDDSLNEWNSNKRFENFWDHNTMHFGKRDEPWHNMMSFGKRSDPWHSMMSFGKRPDNFMDHNTLHFGKKDEPWHNIMSFGKRLENFWDHNTLHFGKKDEWDHNTLHFGKRDPWDHNTLHFGKRDPWDHNTLHFGKRDPWDHNTLHFGKKNDPWHNIMSFGKRSDNLWDHNTLHFGKKDDPWHNMMSFGKKSEKSDMTDLEKREDPWHNMMSFGKKSDGLLNNTVAMTDKRNDPWHSMMSFGKKADYGFDHNTMHFGKREEPWHSMMSFGKKSGNPWDHNTLHFGKRDEPWHNMMSFGKKFDPEVEKNNLLLEKENYPWQESFEKRSDESIDDLSEDFLRNSDPWYEYDGMMFYKKSNPWDHNTLHFGKKSNESLEQALTKEKENSNHIKKRSIDMWNNHHTMHFGKKLDPWESHNTMHFGKRLDPWESHNTMHFGKKSDSIENQSENEFENKESDEDIIKVDNIDKKFDWDSHNTMHFGKRDPEDDRNSFLFGKRDPWDNHNTMHFGKRDAWDYHNTMHFGKRDPWDYHNTMHFGKREPWDYHNTMHFGKRNPWEYQNTMHFGKRSSADSKDGNISLINKNADQQEVKSSRTESVKDQEGNKDDKKTSNIKKRSSDDSKIKEKSNKKNIVKGTSNLEFEYPNSPLQSEVLKHSLDNFRSTIESNANEKGIKSNTVEKLSTKDDSNNRQDSEKKSHIQKRSIRPSSFINSISDNSDANINLIDKYTKDDVADNVLHFGKRSIDGSDEQWLDGEYEKRFDDFWNDHNTLHFGKKSDLWDNHNTLHFGKKSYPQEMYSRMTSTKRDPWEHLNTLHFGKKFDPWEGHAKLHFGKRADSWDHNVMHFGKRNELSPEEVQFLSNLDEFDSVNLQDYIQSLNSQQKDIAENTDFLNNLADLKSIINSRLKDDNIPFEERVSLLKHYLKPLLKAILDAEGPEIASFSGPNDSVNEHMEDYRNDVENVLGESRIIPFQAVNGVNNNEVMLKIGDDESSYGEYGDNSNKASHSIESENLTKAKRKFAGKAELKRYFVPFQGPKSIVYPHAWFASQIRRSALPRTREYARHMEMRMAEKKEDPFNSYMHFGRR